MPDLARDPIAPPADGVPGETLRLVVVDADDRTRESIVGLLGIRDRFRVVGSAGHIGAAVALIREHRPDVVILDPRLPELTGGVVLIRRIRAIDPAIRILAVGWSPELEHDTLAAGADAFIRKTFKPADLAEAIGRCMDAGPRTRPARPDRGAPPEPAPATDPDPRPDARPVPGTGLIL
jgi:DNA-binding NarL/FixJ family response regulator